MNKAQYLGCQYVDIVKNGLLPVDAFTEIILALVRKPMKSYLSEAAKNVQASVNLINPSIGDDSSTEAFENCHSFQWCNLIKGIIKIWHFVEFYLLLIFRRNPRQ